MHHQLPHVGSAPLTDGNKLAHLVERRSLVINYRDSEDIEWTQLPAIGAAKYRLQRWYRVCFVDLVSPELGGVLTLQVNDH